MIKRFSITLAILSGFILTLLFWPKVDSLPNLGRITEQPLQSVTGDTYDITEKKIKLITFFYTNCPDICPMTFIDLNLLKNELEDMDLYENEVRLVSMTLDPEVDTIARLKEYAENFAIDHKGWIMIRGNPQETRKMANQFRMVYKKDDSGFITHSTTMYLLDYKNEIRSYHNMTIGEKKINIRKIVNDINQIMKEETK